MARKLDPAPKVTGSGLQPGGSVASSLVQSISFPGLHHVTDPLHISFSTSAPPPLPPHKHWQPHPCLISLSPLPPPEMVNSAARLQEPRLLLHKVELHWSILRNRFHPIYTVLCATKEHDWLTVKKDNHLTRWTKSYLKGLSPPRGEVAVLQLFRYSSRSAFFFRRGAGI